MIVLCVCALLIYLILCIMYLSAPSVEIHSKGIIVIDVMDMSLNIFVTCINVCISVVLTQC